MSEESYFRNGEVKHRQHQVIPKGKQLYWIQELRLWLLLDKSLTKSQKEKKGREFTEKYLSGLTQMYRDLITKP